MKAIILILSCTLLFSGCVFSNNNPETSSSIVSDLVETVAIESAEQRHLLNATVYYGNENADGFKIKTFQVESLNTSTLVQKLIEVGVLSDDTEILSEEIIGTCIHLDFNTAFQTHICSMGTSGEYMIIGSLVNTFLDNFKDAIESVYITVNGTILESGHVIYDFELTYHE